MQIELSWALFRRLVQLEFLLVALLVPVLLGEFFLFGDIIEAFDSSMTELGYRDAPDVVLMTLILIAIPAYFASLIGMLKRKRWARTLYFAGFVVMWPIGFVIFRPVDWAGIYSTTLVDLLAMVAGATLLLAYSRDHGALWFNTLEDRS